MAKKRRTFTPSFKAKVAFALVSANDQEHMGRFLRNLERSGLAPEVVVTDDSNLYPALLEEVWPQAELQLCVFHVMRDFNKLILDALRRMRRERNRQGEKGCRRKRGRPTKAQKRRRAKQKKSFKAQAKFVFKHRYLIVKRRENFTEQDKENLKTMLQHLPALGALRKFTDRVHALFAPQQSEHQARCRLAALKQPPVEKLADRLCRDFFWARWEQRYWCS